MKPPNVARKELHMDKASEDIEDGEENTNKSLEKDYGDAKESKGASSEDEKEPTMTKESKSMDQIPKDDEDAINDLKQPKAKRKKPITQGHCVKLQKGKGKVKKTPIVERVSNAKTTRQASTKFIAR